MTQALSTGIQLPTGTLARLRADFEAHACVVLPHLLAAGSQQKLLQQLADAQFVATTHHAHDDEEFSKDVTIAGNALALHHIHLLLNRPCLFDVVQAITGCRPIGCFYGRIYRTLPDTDHHLDWHDDDDDAEVGGDSGTRIVGLSVNLSPEPYSGGRFQLRKKRTTALLADITHSRFGDAHLFHIGSDLEHRLTALDGEVARTAAAGWFMDRPQALGLLKSFAVRGQRREVQGGPEREVAP